MKKSNVVGRLVQVAAVEGVGKVRVGRDVEWNEYRVQAWDARGRLAAEYHTDDKADALDSAERMLADLVGPNPEQLAAVAAFAARHGRTWRADLAGAWLNGSDAREPHGHLLRQVRNQHGPAWLERVNLADLVKQVADQAAARLAAEAAAVVAALQDMAVHPSHYAGLADALAEAAVVADQGADALAAAAAMVADQAA